MKLKKIRIVNFRGYAREIDVNIGDMTAFVGQNDAGKSTILEALDIFFNEGQGAVKMDKTDLNVKRRGRGCEEVEIACAFSSLPEAIATDGSSSTSLNLKQNYMLNSNGLLEVVKRYKMTSESPRATVYIKAVHPNNKKCSELLSKTREELRGILDQFDISCDDRRECASMRSAIWAHFSDNLDLQERLVKVYGDGGQESDTVWNLLKNCLPVYSLFRSDRKNSDGDSEVQDPLKEAVKVILSDAKITKSLNKVAEKVRAYLQRVARATLKKLREMNPDIAEALNPRIPHANNLKWQDVFKGLSITGDENIPINKRGSGVRRLILINFLRAELEKKTEKGDNISVIYAMEEPETSQHVLNQKNLIDTLKKLSRKTHIQVILTTHSSTVVKCLDYKNTKIVQKEHTVVAVKDVAETSAVHKSLSEINYLVFGDASEEYHDELYGELSLILHEKFRDATIKNFEEMLKEEGMDICETWRREKEERKKTKKKVCRCAGDFPATKRAKEENIKVQEVTLQTYIRHSIHHPENKLNKRYTSAQITQSIEAMRTCLIRLHNEGY